MKPVEEKVEATPGEEEDADADEVIQAIKNTCNEGLGAHKPKAVTDFQVRPADRLSHEIDYRIAEKPVHNILNNNEFRLQREQKGKKREFEKEKRQPPIAEHFRTKSSQVVHPSPSKKHSSVEAIPSGTPLKPSQVVHLISHSMSKGQPPIVEYFRTKPSQDNLPQCSILEPSRPRWRTQALQRRQSSVEPVASGTPLKPSQVVHLIPHSIPKDNLPQWGIPDFIEDLRSTTWDFLCLCGARPELVAQATTCGMRHRPAARAT
ncbi:hypothetical protein JCGZ_15276 [Jatropha curcas]|uniref:Uncharacterized protein n=1 Tax=Jatropha curcas TaxID=180498 RepID=A0A067K9I6_JATCU|nr:hypothetical protein JCGZ_15276 [Jatropha curcas]